MTREEAIKVIRKMLACTDLSVRANLTADMVDACHMAIKALEQEPVINKIRAEIENHCGLTKENHCRYCSYCNNVMGVREILEIIDKYKSESEVDNGNND